MKIGRSLTQKSKLSPLLLLVALFCWVMSSFIAQTHASSRASLCHNMVRMIQSGAIEPVERVDISQLGMGPYDFDRYTEFSYSGRSRLLLLSHGQRDELAIERDQQTQAPQILSPQSVQVPERLIVKTDISAFDGISVMADNLALPFQSNTFDTIVLNRGLCACHNETHTCCGLNLENQQTERFLAQVAEILDSTSPHALAILTGASFFDSMEQRAPMTYVLAVMKLRERYPQFKWEILSHPQSRNLYNFVGLAISTTSRTTEELLAQLVASDSAQN